MEALKLFSKYAPNKTYIAIVFGGLSGLSYAFLIPTVLAALSINDSQLVVDDKLINILGWEVAHSQFAFLFLSLCFVILIFQSLSEILLGRIALDIRYKLRKDLYRKVQNAPIDSLENVGSSKLIQALSTDVSAIVMGASLFPRILSNSVMLIGMFGYLAYIDFSTFVFVIKVITFGVITYQVPIYFGAKYFAAARENQDILQEAFRGLVSGAKELKLCIYKQQSYEEKFLYKQEEVIRDLEKKGHMIFSLADNYGGLLSFFAIGLLSFIFVNYNHLSHDQIVASVMVMLYVTSPVGVLLNFIPQLSRTRISLNKIDQLYRELPSEKCSTKVKNIGDWTSLLLHNVKYKHLQNNSHIKAFQIGPISLEIRRGEITFIAGGNGSGKSTLAKVISQHYLPSQGDIFYDDIKIDEMNLASFRKEISCIYSDYYLFDAFLNIDSLSSEYEDLVNHYLESFGLQDKVKITDGNFSTLKLSDGQRRRLALIVAIIEDKSLLVFDEWAADQDPKFKQTFYHEILPLLKSKGKAVVVISHDDRYFDVADKLLVMESGCLVTDSS